jgi:hypothetical protein
MSKRPIQCVVLALKVILQQTITSVLVQLQDGSADSARALDTLASEYDAKSAERSKLLSSDSLPIADRSAIIAFVLTVMHFRDLLRSLHDSNCTAVEDFAWASSMRMVWLPAEHASPSTYAMKIFDFVVAYGFDVDSGASGHVSTPQTTRFNLGVVSAVRSLCCCHALCGPSGKTSLIENLAANLGRSVVSADVKSHVSADRIPLLMTAAAASMVWIALDNVETWSTELLSQFSQALLSILANVRKMGDHPNALVHPSPPTQGVHCGALFFLTASESFSLSVPSTLCSAVTRHFRPSRVTFPDEFVIAEAFFVLRGFDSARIIAKKMQHLFSEWRALLPLPCPQLSIKHLSAVAMCARRIVGCSSSSAPREVECVGAAVRLIALPICPPDLMTLIQPLVELLFPPAVETIHGLIPVDALKSAFSKALMSWSDVMGATAVQLCTALQISTGVAVIGSCCSGKSSLIAIASAHFSSRHTVVDVTSIDPEYCANLASSAVDSILNPIFNSSPESEIRSGCIWLHCDGDITSASDALLSHSRLKQMLRSDPAVSLDRVVFETDVLHRAPPSIVGTLSIVHCPTGMLPHKIYLEELVKSLKFSNKATQQHVTDLLLAVLPLTLETLFPEGCGEDDAAWLRHRQLMANVVHLLTSMFTSDACDMLPSACAKLFTFCLFWGLAGSIDRCIWDDSTSCYLEGDEMLQFLGARVRKMCSTSVMLPPISEREDLHEYSVSASGDWRRWETALADPLPLAGGISFFVRTSRTSPALCILSSLMIGGQNAALIGCRGSGKSALVSAVTAKLLMASSSTSTFSCATFKPMSVNTTVAASALESFLRGQLHVSEAGMYTPAHAANLVVVIDDLSMCPAAVRPSFNAAIRRYFGSAHVGSRNALGCMNDPQKCGVARRISASSVLVTASSSDFILPRAARHLVTVRLAAPSETHLSSVFEAVAQASFSTCSPDVQGHMVKLAAVSVSVYHQTLRLVSPVAATFFPVPHPSDCLKVIDGCLASGSVNTASTKSLQRVWLNEMCRVFRDRFGTVGFGEFDKMFKGVCSNMLEAHVTDANIAQLWTRFHSLDNELYAPVSNIDIVIDLLRARLSEYHRKHKEHLNIILERASIEVISFIARVLQQSSGHCALLDHDHISSRSLCLFSGYLADFSVLEMPALASSSDGVSYIRAVAAQCVESNKSIALIIREEALVFADVLQLLTAVVDSSASAVFEQHMLLHLARKVSEMLPISGKSTLEIINTFASNALQRNLKIILLARSSPTSPIAFLPRISSKFTFHCNVQPQSSYFYAALQESLGSGFAENSVGNTKSQVIADALTNLRDTVLLECDKANLGSAIKRKIASEGCCLHVVQAFCSDVTSRSEALANSISLTRNTISVCAALMNDVEELSLKMQQLRQQIDHTRLERQDIDVTCRELKAATVCASRPPLEHSKVRMQLLGFADHILVDFMSGSNVSFVESIGEALLITLNLITDENYGLPQEYFKGMGAITQIKDALKKKGCVAQADSHSSSWILEGISRHAAVKQDSIVRLHSVLARGNLQALYNSCSGRLEEFQDDFEKCILEFLVSLHNAAREQEMHNSEGIFEGVVQKEIDIQNMLDESILVHRSLTKMCESIKPLEQKWKMDLEALQLQQSRIVGDGLQIAVQLVWGVLFPPGHRQVLVARVSECISVHGIDAINSISDLNVGFKSNALSVYERLVFSALTHKVLGLDWTLCYDPDQQLLPALERHVQSEQRGVHELVVRTDDPSFVDIVERSISRGNLLVVHVVEASVPGILLDLVRTRTLQSFGRLYVRIGSRLIEAHKNFSLVLQLSLLRFDDVPELFGSCRAVDLSLHMDSLTRYLAAAMVLGKDSESEISLVSNVRAASLHEAELQSESRIMHIINNSSLRVLSSALELIESANELLEQHINLQTDLKLHADKFEQLNAASESHKNFAKDAASMFRNLRAMHVIDRNAGCTLPMLLDICYHVTQTLKLPVNESSPVLFHILCHHMDHVPRLIFALLFSCARDAQFTASELLFLHSPIGFNVSPVIDGYNRPDTRALDWLSLDIWARVAAFTTLPGVGVDVLKSLRSNADAWKKWFTSIDKGAVEQFPDGFSKKLTPLQCVCLARCFSEHLLKPTLQLYVARTLGAAFDESRFDMEWITLAKIPVPTVVKECNGWHAMSAVLEMREALHGDHNIFCLIADGSNWPRHISDISEKMSMGRWVIMFCTSALPWDSFMQLCENAAKYHGEITSRLFIVQSASVFMPRDASAMCLHLNASGQSSPNALFESIYMKLIPLSLPKSNGNMSVSDAFKHLASARQSVFQLVCSVVLAVRHDATINVQHTGDMRNRHFLKILGLRCAFAANALFKHFREFPKSNLPIGYTYATVDDVVKEGLKELNEWAPLSAASRFSSSIPSILGSAAPSSTLQQQGGSDLMQHMASFCWPSTVQQLNIDVTHLACVQKRDSKQLQDAMQTIPCVFPCRLMHVIPFDFAQIQSILDLLPSESEIRQLFTQRDCVSTADDMAACVGRVALLSMSHVCGIIHQLRAFIRGVVGYNNGLLSWIHLLSGVPKFFSNFLNTPIISLFSSVGIVTLRAAIEQRIIPRYRALKSAMKYSDAGVFLGAFHVPYRLIAVARLHAACVYNAPVESLRIQASVVAGIEKTGVPMLLVCDVFARNAILTTNKENDCDAIIFKSQSFQPLPVALIISKDATEDKSGTDSSALGFNVAEVPMFLYVPTSTEEAFYRTAITLAGE